MHEDEHGILGRSSAALCTEVGADESYGKGVGGRRSEIRWVGDSIHIQAKSAVRAREGRCRTTTDRGGWRGLYSSEMNSYCITAMAVMGLAMEPIRKGARGVTGGPDGNQRDPSTNNRRTPPPAPAR